MEGGIVKHNRSYPAITANLSVGTKGIIAQTPTRTFVSVEDVIKPKVYTLN